MLSLNRSTHNGSRAPGRCASGIRAATLGAVAVAVAGGSASAAAPPSWSNAYR